MRAHGEPRPLHALSTGASLWIGPLIATLTLYAVFLFATAGR